MPELGIDRGDGKQCSPSDRPVDLNLSPSGRSSSPRKGRLARRSTCLVNGYSVDDRMIGEVEGREAGSHVAARGSVRGAVHSS